MTNETAIHRLLLVRHRKDCTELLAEALDMAIEALRRGLENVNADSCSESPNRSDLISRQDAIDALATFVPYAIYDESTESYTNGLTDAYNLICQLPSVQPEKSTTEEKSQLAEEKSTRKLIYLDDAIDTIEAITWYHQNRNNEMVSGANSSEHQAWYKAEDVYKALEELPSAEPEIIRCENCIHIYDNDCPIHWNGKEFCNFAERKDNG